MAQRGRQTFDVGSLVELRNDTPSGREWNPGRITKITPKRLGEEPKAVIVARDEDVLLQWNGKNHDPLPQTKWKHYMRLADLPNTNVDPEDGAPVDDERNNILPWKNYKHVQPQPKRLPGGVITWTTDEHGIPSALVTAHKKDYNFTIAGDELKHHRRIVKAAHLFLELVNKSKERDYLSDVGWPTQWKADDMYRCANAALQQNSNSALDTIELEVWNSNRTKGEMYWTKTPNPDRSFRFLDANWRTRYFGRIDTVAGKLLPELSVQMQQRQIAMTIALNNDSKSGKYKPNNDS